jgi:HSP20 family molecular chaperone IbpA
MTTLATSHLLSLDGIGRAIERAAGKGGDGYPPFNIERLAGTEKRDEILRIVLAVAGFGPDDLEVEVADNRLVIRGRQADEIERTYLHRGIAARRFQRSFVLRDGLEVVAADLDNGLLSIDLARPRIEKRVRRIAINEPAEPDSVRKE